MACSIFWEGSKEREKNQSRRKLHDRRGLANSINVRSTDKRTITLPLLLVNIDYASRHLYKSRTDIFKILSDLLYKI